MRNQMKFAASLLFVASAAFAGGSQGGGTPPAMQDLSDSLMSNTELSAGLFRTTDGDVNLGVNGQLSSELVLTRSGSASPSLTLSNSDFELIRTKTSVDAIDLNTTGVDLAKSYRIEDGNKLGELLLKDRRELVRSSVR